jgi:uncharacterized protein (DUF983 family)
MARHELTSSLLHMGLRGVVGCCPRCGARSRLREWFRRSERCRTCGYRHERQDGFMLGAMTMNLLATFFLLAVVIVVGTVASYPDIPVAKMVGAGAAIALGWPLFFYPMSYTAWAAVDLAMHPLEPEEIADADAHAEASWLAQQRQVGA